MPDGKSRVPMPRFNISGERFEVKGLEHALQNNVPTSSLWEQVRELERQRKEAIDMCGDVLETIKVNYLRKSLVIQAEDPDRQLLADTHFGAMLVNWDARLRRIKENK